MYIFPLVEWPICCGVVCILHVLGLRYYRLNCNYFYRYLAVCLSHLFTAVQNLSSQDSRPVDKSAREYPGAMVPFALTWISEGEQILSTDPPHVEWLHRFSPRSVLEMSAHPVRGSIWRLPVRKFVVSHHHNNDAASGIQEYFYCHGHLQ